jgi:glycosyltransferase involved in cell wall biosynthesis
MKILGIAHPNSGCGYHRIVLPLMMMEGIEGICTNKPTDEVLSEQWDVLFYNRVSMFDNSLEETKKRLGCKIVVDMDDSWKLPSNHLNYYDYQHMNAQIENNLRVADLVTCTNERLANEIRPYNSNVQIIPNAIPYGYHQFTDDKIEDERLRIFWCGGITHEGDLELLKNPFRKLLIHKDKIKMVLGGYTATDELSKWLWDKMLSYFTNSMKLEFRALAGTSPNLYMDMYKNADIMVVPLLQSDWSACKSNLKLLEAATKGIPVICSKVEPYASDTDAPVLWVEKQSDWFKHLNFLINNKNARLDYGQNLKEWAARKYDFFTINNKRKTAFEETCGTQTHI